MLGGMALIENPSGLDVGLLKNLSTWWFRYTKKQLSHFNGKFRKEAMWETSIAQQKMKKNRGGGVESK